MEFSPKNLIVRLCIQGMDMEEKGKTAEARQLFMQAWNEASNNFEKFIAAHYVARQQDNIKDTLKWLETDLELALKVNDHAVKPAFAPLYTNIATCYEELNDSVNAKKNFDSADSFTEEVTDKGPFYHGTKADLKVGELLRAGHNSNYKDGFTMNHIYFTALPNGAGLAAALAKGDGRERIYIVEATGSIEHDPNVTNKKFPGNPTRSYRTVGPLKIVGEAKDWKGDSSEEIQKWKERLADNKGDIIN
ncbi:MAG: NAD(+)--rifampin ADP-ribosyltransferase [Bacteroidia bacterium]|nr:NAD(+)--rifampin ADP-ribosyltransferase [Bacteroidia bacterium]